MLLEWVKWASEENVGVVDWMDGWTPLRLMTYRAPAVLTKLGRLTLNTCAFERRHVGCRKEHSVYSSMSVLSRA